VVIIYGANCEQEQQTSQNKNSHRDFKLASVDQHKSGCKKRCLFLSINNKSSKNNKK
jgi:hypothetical protein